ncbi:MAG TPA: hypothetical protein HPP87_13710 [Planctomycetes bacterium]|nr:hypothetical protein [Planctomycetota bacterium]
MDIQALTRFFMWCTIINAGLLVFSAVMFMSAQDFVYSMHSKWFNIPRETFNVAIYSFLGFFKIIFILFNLVPYLALLIIG